MPLMTMQDVASQLAVSTRTVRRWHEAGVLPLLRLPGGSLRVEDTALAALLERGRMTGGGQSNG